MISSTAGIDLLQAGGSTRDPTKSNNGCSLKERAEGRENMRSNLVNKSTKLWKCILEADVERGNERKSKG